MARRYKGTLARQIDPASLLARQIDWQDGTHRGLLSFTGDDAGWARSLTEARIAKLPELAVFYGIDPAGPGACYLLAMMLAVDWVPGFQVRPIGKKAPNRPKKWTPERRMELWADFIAMKRAGHEGDGLLRLLGNQPQWRGVTVNQMKRKLREKSAMGPLWTKLLRRLKAEGAPVEDWILEAHASAKVPETKTL